ncbi:hypothetical protein ILYODFUR_029590 [Ilyodon furcidens]|uniref:Uncharacterized protein n=1 Tax=Ilyodon furcidens TaxID=33524 RepID=A0ABV0VIF8_9TELE
MCLQDVVDFFPAVWRHSPVVLKNQVKVDTLCGNTWCPLNRSKPNQCTRIPVDRLVVLEEDQVSAYKSKSRYNRKQLRFSRFRYTPTEPIVLQAPMFPHHGKISHHPGKKGY